MAKIKNIETPKPATVKCEYNAQTSCHFEYKGSEYNLLQGKQYDLPAESKTVKSLLAQKRLTIVKTTDEIESDKK